MLIGLTGRAGVGKDTVANHLQAAHGFAGYALASPIKNGLKAMLGLTDADFEDRARKEVPHARFGVSPRRMAQTLGTEWGRQCINEKLWLMCADRVVEEAHAARVPLVITDIRFQNEADWLRSHNGILIHVLRNGVAAVESHSSEAGVNIDPRDCTLMNNGTYVQLYREIDRMVRAMDDIVRELATC